MVISPCYSIFLKKINRMECMECMCVCVCFFLFEMGYVSFKNESIVPGGHVFLVHVE